MCYTIYHTPIIATRNGGNQMSKYIGQPCTSCRNVFKEGDEIVVCPECGSPYHKNCYQLEGRCINTLLHESGSEWHPEPVVGINSSATEAVCPNCGAHNDPESFFCTSCGASLKSERPGYDSIPTYTDMAGGSANNNAGRQQQTYQNPYGQPFVNYQTVPEDAPVDSNTAGEYMRYVGVKFYYYLPKFMKFAKGESKASLNFAALFFTPFWFFYRKMPLYGIVTLVLRIIVSIPSVVEYMFAFMSVSEGVAYTGIDSPVFTAVSGICMIVSWVVSILACAFGNYLYYKKAKKDIDDIKINDTTGLDLQNKIASAGGVSMAYVVIAFVALSVVSSIISTILMFTMNIY